MVHIRKDEGEVRSSRYVNKLTNSNLSCLNKGREGYSVFEPMSNSAAQFVMASRCVQEVADLLSHPT